MGAGVPWFLGSPEAYRTAEIKREGQLRALGQVSAGAGRVLGAYRQGQDDATKAAEQDAYLNATLGQQQDKAVSQATPTADSPAPPSQEETALQRIARKTTEGGMAALRATGAAIGLASPDTPETQAAQLRNAGKAGQVQRETMDTKMLGALHPIFEYGQGDLGDMARRATKGRVDLGSIPSAPKTTGGEHETYMHYLHVANDPTAAPADRDLARKIVGEYEQSLKDRTQPAAAYAPPGDKYRDQAISDLVREKQRAGWPGTYETIAPQLDPAEVQARGDQLEKQQDPLGSLVKRVGRVVGGNVTLPGDETSPEKAPTSAQPPDQASGGGIVRDRRSADAMGLGPSTPTTMKQYAERLAGEVSAGRMTKDEAVKKLKEAASAPLVQ